MTSICGPAELPCPAVRRWEVVMKAAGFFNAAVANRADTLAGAAEEEKATTFGTFGYSIRSSKP
jgi:hypothetical protein